MTVVARMDHAISISLDRRIPIEAMVLQRLFRLPATRQDEWLRQLLLVGFRSECQVIRAEQGQQPRAALAPPTSHRSLPLGSKAGAAEPPSTEAAAIPPLLGTDREQRHGPVSPVFAQKPFTHLQRILGE